MIHKILLADIGNTHFHIYDGKEVFHLSYADAIKKYKDTGLQYISVNEKIEEIIGNFKLWKNISSKIKIKGEYDTMGVDRKALCLSHKNGIFVDAGSAITVDIVEDAVYQGGFILPGIKAYLQSYKSISPVLETTLASGIELMQLPCTTKEQISYGIIASIKVLIDKHSKDKKLYFTGGDGKFLSTFFKDAVYDEILVFYGILEAIEDKVIC